MLKKNQGKRKIDKNYLKSDLVYILLTTMSELYPEPSDSEEETTKIIVNPYNFNNKHVNEKFISSIFKRFDMPYQPHNMDLYQNAFIHKSYCK